MSTRLSTWYFALAAPLGLTPSVAFAKGPGPVLEIDPAGRPAAAVEHAPATIASSDTIWIADWSFDLPSGGCTDAGWIRYDNRILNDGSNYWSVNNSFSGTGGISNQAAVLAKHDLTWVRDGYGNSWDYSIILKYQGAAATLSFDYLSDSEPGIDFVTVEADSGGASESRVDYATAPGGGPAAYRSELLSVDGVHNASVVSIALPDFGVPTTQHEVYIRFFSDDGYSDEDGLYPTTWNAGLVVDNIVVTGSLAYSENFEGALNANISLVNTAPSTPFGEWARLYQHITDNDKCTENMTCAWLWTDPDLDAFTPDMAFGPGGAIVRNWLDDVIVSPWVSLASTPSATSTVLSYARFRGNDFNQGRIVQNWSIRSLVKIDNTDTSILGDSITVVSGWAHASIWNSLGDFFWYTAYADATTYVEPGALEIQVRFRVSDWQYIEGSSPPVTLNPGPGPFIDHVRIGRAIPTGPRLQPTLNLRGQPQDGFPSEEIPGWPRIVPTADRFGTCDFSAALVQPEGTPYGSEYRLLDSLETVITDVREAGITGVGICAAIVSGPHAGKAPPPWSVGADGFFHVPAEPLNPYNDTNWFVDLDDQYFRGGDRLVYFWWATDGAGGFSSCPAGLTAIPNSIAEAQEATGGLLELAFLPTIDWDPGYLARIAAHPSGKVDPTSEEIANSSQEACILYVLQRPGPRRNGPGHRSAFMHTLNQLGYEGLYDQFYVNTAALGPLYLHHLASRASLEQVKGYPLIIQDSGTLDWNAIPPGGERERPVNQVEWYRQWLAQAQSSDAGHAGLWILGDRVVSEAQYPYNQLIGDDMGVLLVDPSQSVWPYPNITGERSFTWASGDSTDFAGDQITLNSGVCDQRDNDALGATGTAVMTHRYVLGATVGDGAVVMNANPSEAWDTIMMSFSWEDLLDLTGSPPSNRQVDLASKILSGVLAGSCGPGLPTDTATRSAALPRVSVLHPNAPNPFNPVTTIRFDLATTGRVRLLVYDVAGRRVRTLVDEWQEAGWNHHATWNGLDDRGHRVASGIYLYRLSAGEFTSTRKMIVVR